MYPFRFLHTADLHLGTPFQGLSKSVDTHWLSRVQNASYRVFARIVDLAITHQVDFVTIAGDLFDSRNVSMAVQFELRRGFARLHEAGIPVVLTHGNHDPFSGRSAVHWPDNVTVLKAAPTVPQPDYHASSVRLDIRGTRVQICGFSYAQTEIRQSLASTFDRDKECDFAIGLYHGVVGAAGAHANYCATREEELIQRGFDFWGLGHIHKAAVLRDSAPAIVYPGNPQGRHINEDGLRGCVLADVDEQGRIAMTMLATSEVVWSTRCIDVSDLPDAPCVLDQVSRDIQSFIRSGPEDARPLPHIVRLELTGRTPAHADLMDGEALLRGLQRAVEDIQPPVLIEQVKVKTLPAVDLDTLANSTEFIGELLRITRAYREDLRAARTFLLQDVQRVFQPANGQTAEDLTDLQILQLFEHAERLVLQYIGEQEAAG